MKYKVNLDLLPMKIFYFCYMAAIPSLILYVSPLFEQLGLSTDEIGITGCAAALIGFFSRSLFGALVDKYQCFKQILIMSSFASAIAFCLLLLLPKDQSLVHDMSSITIRSNNITLCAPANIPADCPPIMINHTTDCSSFNNESCWPKQFTDCSIDNRSTTIKLVAVAAPSSNCISYNVSADVRFNATMTSFDLSSCYNVNLSKSNELCLPKRGNESIATKTRQAPTRSNFWPAFVLRTIAYFFFAPGLSLMDAVTFQIVADKPEKFGFTRSFGSIGFLVFSLITGFALYYATQGIINYTPSFFLYSSLMLITSIVAAFMPKPVDVHTVNIFKSMRLYCLSARFVVFYGVCFALGVCMSVLEHYVFMAVGSMFITPPYFFGLMSAVMVITETPVFQISGYIIKKIGAPACLCISLLTWALRFFSYSMINSHWPVLGIEITHGVAFGFMMSSMSTYASQIAPKGAEATVQGIAQGISFGLGPAIGSLIGGMLYRRLGIRLFFQVCACFALSCCLIYGIIYRIVSLSADRRDAVKSTKETTPNNNDCVLSDLRIVEPDESSEKLMNTEKANVNA